MEYHDEPPEFSMFVGLNIFLVRDWLAGTIARPDCVFLSATIASEINNVAKL